MKALILDEISYKNPGPHHPVLGHRLIQPPPHLKEPNKALPLVVEECKADLMGDKSWRKVKPDGIIMLFLERAHKIEREVPECWQ